MEKRDNFIECIAKSRKEITETSIFGGLAGFGLGVTIGVPFLIVTGLTGYTPIVIAGTTTQGIILGAATEIERLCL